jgi:hypothetical protein
VSDNDVVSTFSLATGVTLGGTTGFSCETGGWTGAVGFALDEPVEPGAEVPVVGAPLEEPEDPGAPDSGPDEQPAITTARATAATAFLMRTILANRAKRSR